MVAETGVALYTYIETFDTHVYATDGEMASGTPEDSKLRGTAVNATSFCPCHLTPGAAGTTAGRTLLQLIIFIISRCAALSLLIRVHVKS